jgi:hypothetical protein
VLVIHCKRASSKKRKLPSSLKAPLNGFAQICYAHQQRNKTVSLHAWVTFLVNRLTPRLCVNAVESAADAKKCSDRRTPPHSSQTQSLGTNAIKTSKHSRVSRHAGRPSISRPVNLIGSRCGEFDHTILGLRVQINWLRHGTSNVLFLFWKLCCIGETFIIRRYCL